MVSLDRLKAFRPKAPPYLAEFARRHLSRFTPGFWLCGAIAGALTLMLVLLLVKLFLSGAALSGRAMETGQRVIIHMASNDMEGNPRHTKAAVAPATPSAPAADGSAPIVSKGGLAPAPLAAISAQTDKGLVPMVGQDGTLPWKYYARPYKGDGKRPMIAIVITHLGLNKGLTEDTLKLPHNFTLSFSPYASDARKWATTAREEGFETLVDLPMQSADYIRTGADPGPHGLFEDTGIDEASNRLRWVLSRFAGFVGALAPEDEILTSNLSVIRPTLIELTGHGVLFLYVKSPKNTALADAIKARQLFALGVDMLIDQDIAPGPIDTQLQALTALAKTQGYAIGFAHSYPPTLDALSRWAESLDAQGIDLVPVSAIGMKVLP